MLITKRSDYAMRIIRALQDGKLHNIADVCDREEIPKAFAYKILRELENNQIVTSVRGNKGGYILKASLDELTLYDLFIIVDEDTAILHCMKEKCSRNQKDCPCHVHSEIVRIQAILNKELRSKTLREVFCVDQCQV